MTEVHTRLDACSLRCAYKAGSNPRRLTSFPFLLGQIKASPRRYAVAPACGIAGCLDSRSLGPEPLEAKAVGRQGLET